MAGKIIIDTERCKGCGLCVEACPKDNIVISNHCNKSGYFPAEATNANCTGCAMCAIICPDAVITVLREDNVAEIKTGPKKKAKLAEEKV